MGNKVYVLIAASIGLLLGFILGGGNAPPETAEISDGVKSSTDTGKTLSKSEGISRSTEGSFNGEVSSSASLLAEEDVSPRKGRTPSDLRDRLFAAQVDSNPITRTAAFAEVLSELDENNVDAVLEAFEDLSFGFEHMQEYRMLLYGWGQFDPLKAIEYCNERAKGIGAGFATSGVLEGWASREPQAAADWVKSPDNAGMAKLYNFGLVRGWASRDLSGASQYVAGLDSGDETGKLVGILAEQHMKQGFTSARQWAETLQEDSLKKGAFTNLTRQVSRERPEEVAGWLKEHASKEYATDSLRQLGDNWGERDPVSAIEYFDELPAGKGKQQGIREVMQSWSRDDPEASGKWLNDQEPTAELDPAVAAYARQVSKDDGASAMEWAVSITEPDLQKKTITQVGHNWYRQDKDSVEAWLPESGLPEATQNAIKAPPKQSWWESLRPGK